MGLGALSKAGLTCLKKAGQLATKEGAKLIEKEGVEVGKQVIQQAEKQLVEKEGVKVVVEEGVQQGMAGVVNKLPKIGRAVNSNIPHAIEKSIERQVFSTAEEASQKLRALTSKISKEGLPANALLDPKRVDRIFVPVGNNGIAVYQIAKNRTAKLKTVLIRK